MRQTKHVTQKLTPACVPGQDGTGYEEKKKEEDHTKKPHTNHSEKDEEKQGTINTTNPQKKRESST